MRPDYDGGSIVNVVSSVLARFGLEPAHPPARLVLPRSLASRVVLVLVDGLGADTFDALAGSLAKRKIGTLTSVYPSTTATAITSIMTASTPLEHGVFGWTLDDPRLGGVIEILPHRHVAGSLSLESGAIMRELGFTDASIFKRLSGSAAIHPDLIKDSPYNEALVGDSQYVYEYVEQLPTLIEEVARDHRFVFAYTPIIDSLSHRCGKTSDAVRFAYEHVERLIVDAASRLEDTTFLVTADHGQVVSDGVVELPAAALDCLASPASGDTRMLVCKLRPGTLARFERALRGLPLEIRDPDELVAAGWFGQGTVSDRIRARLGDRILVPTGTGELRAPIAGKRKKNHTGLHSGSSDEEMLVPLVRIDR